MKYVGRRTKLSRVDTGSCRIMLCVCYAHVINSDTVQHFICMWCVQFADLISRKPLIDLIPVMTYVAMFCCRCI